VPEQIRILLVEDESLVSMLAEDVLTEAGYDVVLAMTLKAALEAAEAEPFHAAVLDVNLGAGQNSFPVATHLNARGIPFLFATGYGKHGLVEEFQSRPVITKPYSSRDLVNGVALLLT
jgi:DNA-binding response OmpR family regulator